MSSQSKKELRREMKLMLANLDTRWSQKAHVEVCSHLIRVLNQIGDRNGRKHVFAWVPCFPGEVDLAMFIGEALKSAQVYLPRVDDSNTMSFVSIGEDWSSHLAPGARGISQPREGYGAPAQFDESGTYIVVTPGLAFDESGRRLGRGGGHYDRFFEGLGLAHSVKIGVCWSMQLVRAIPVDPHDVNMDWICHEKGGFRPNGEDDGKVS
jgi:5-formyltetrahydrofolate cyclo-ligase